MQEKVIKINGINNTTWTPAWNHGKTQIIRVPIALVDRILDYARALDTHEKSSDAKTEDFIVLSAIDRYIKWRRRSYYHANKYAKEPNVNSRAWDELRKFRAMVERGDMGTDFEVSD